MNLFNPEELQKLKIVKKNIQTSTPVVKVVKLQFNKKFGRKKPQGTAQMVRTWDSMSFLFFDY
jgi:hypothetical protein